MQALLFSHGDTKSMDIRAETVLRRQRRASHFYTRGKSVTLEGYLILSTEIFIL
jgi:hypothetical protein